MIDYIQDLIFENEELEATQIALPEIEQKLSPYVVVYKKLTPTHAVVTLAYRSNKKCFLVSEVYKNVSFGLKKAEELAEFLNTTLEVNKK